MKSKMTQKLVNLANEFFKPIRPSWNRLHNLLKADVFFGRSPSSVTGGSIVFFPIQPNVLRCGIAAIVSYKSAKPGNALHSVTSLGKMVKPIEDQGCQACRNNGFTGLDQNYLGGKDLIESLWQRVQAFKGEKSFFAIYTNPKERQLLHTVGERLTGIAGTEAAILADHMGRIPAKEVELMAARIDKLQDIAWGIRCEILDNFEKIDALLNGNQKQPQPSVVSTFQKIKKINTVLNSIDRLEVRGRDSAGISLIFVFGKGKKSRKPAAGALQSKNIGKPRYRYTPNTKRYKGRSDCSCHDL
jgi:glucosamine--fructose-6-phosphate aminotransferase (isomerizing)